MIEATGWMTGWTIGCFLIIVLFICSAVCENYTTFANFWGVIHSPVFYKKKKIWCIRQQQVIRYNISGKTPVLRLMLSRWSTGGPDGKISCVINFRVSPQINFPVRHFIRQMIKEKKMFTPSISHVFPMLTLTRPLQHDAVVMCLHLLHWKRKEKMVAWLHWRAEKGRGIRGSGSGHSLDLYLRWVSI